MTRFSFLHISDCHFGIRHHFKQHSSNSVTSSLAEAIEGAIETDTPINGLVVSGDVFTSPSKRGGDEFDHAYTGLRELVDAFEIPLDNVFFVPGNHDLERGRETDPKRAFEHYDKLTKKLGVEKQKVSDLPKLKILDSEPPVAMLLLNSCKAEGAANSGIGLIGQAQRNKAGKLLDKHRVTPDTHVIVAVLHHHLVPIVDQQLVELNDPHSEIDRKPSLTTDASETLQFLSERRVSLVLHGHQHEPALVEYCDRLHTPSSRLTIAAAGSCGAKVKSGSKRHFWVHDIDDASITSTMYTQKDGNAHQFKRHDGGAIRTGRAYAGNLRAIDGCHVHAESSFHPGVIRRRPVESDLSLVFMSVTDCPRARDTIREAVASYQRSQVESAADETIELDGMYDLLGYWDLLVRLRVPPRMNPSWVFDSLQEKLKERNIQRDGADFEDFEIVDVRWEMPRLADHDSRQSLDTVELRRTQLPDTDAYDRLRSQRAFLYIKLPERDRGVFISEVSKAIEAAGVGSIVETAAVSHRELVLDIFLRCADSAAINRLNRAVEPVLGPRGCQKYTLLCYGYDEAHPAVGPMTPQIADGAL